MKITFKNEEIIDLLKAWFMISLAFGILITGSLSSYGKINGFLIALGIASITVGISFIVHELAHKIMALKYYCLAEFKANNVMLILAVIMSFANFIFVAPGAVIIKGSINNKQNGKIALAGPFSNLVLSLIFLPSIFFSQGLINFFFYQGFFINAWLGLFNMIPFVPFDGVNVFKWNKIIYFAITSILLILVLFSIL